jgi:transposase
MIVIGTDTHKRSHALCAVDEGTGRVRGSREIKADEAGHQAAVRWARGLDEERVWAIEDCRQVSRRLEQALLAAGERVIRVPPKRMGASRRGERERGKSDQIDAQAVARAVVKDGVDRFPVAYLDERAMEIRLLSDHREDLVKERTRMINRLRWHLLQLCPELEANLKRGGLSEPRALERLDRRLRRLAPSVRLNCRTRGAPEGRQCGFDRSACVSRGCVSATSRGRRGHPDASESAAAAVGVLSRGLGRECGQRRPDLRGVSVAR